MKSIELLFLIVLLSFNYAISQENEPANTCMNTADPISLNTTINGSLGSTFTTPPVCSPMQVTDIRDYYQFSTTSEGALQIIINPEATLSFSIELYCYGEDAFGNFEGASLDYTSISTGIPDTLKTYLGVGTYIIEVTHWNTTSGNYSMAVNFSSTPYAIDTEINDTYSQANQIYNNSTFTGHIGFTRHGQDNNGHFVCGGDMWDWFYLDLSSYGSGQLNVTMTPSSTLIPRLDITEEASPGLAIGSIFGTMGLPASTNVSITGGQIYYILVHNNVGGWNAGSYQVYVNYTSGSNPMPEISVNQTSLSFGNVLSGQVSAEQSVVISNTGTASLDISSITSPNSFEVKKGTSGNWVSNISSFSISAGSTETIYVHFMPSQIQTYNGNVVINSNDADEPVTNVSVNGTGITSTPGPEISVNSNNLNFGTILTGQTSPSQNFVISNSGTANLNISGITAPIAFEIKKGISGTWSNNITGFSIAASSNETIYVQFSPTANQTYNSNVIISSDDADEPITNIAVSGTGYTTPTNGIFTENATLPGYYEGNAAWGDYDNDNDLDLLVMGKTSSSETVTKLYNNNNGTFTEVTGTPFSQAQGPASWFDADNDGDLDLLLTGCGWNGTGMTRLYINNNGTFTLSSCSFTQLGLGYTESGDYNNDGMTDFLINGESSNQSYTLLYKSNDLLANCHGETGTFQGVRFGTARLTDYDNDGDNDIMLSGQTFITTTNCDNYAKIYKNENGSFTETANSFLPLDKGSMLIADFNNNGFFDVLLTGKTNNQYTNSTNLYVNDGSTFTEVSTGLPMYSTDNYHSPQSAASADLDNDGYMDIILTGYTGVNSNDQISKTQVFLNSFPSFVPSGDSLPPFYRSHLTLGDFNNDHKIDFVLAGQLPLGICKLFVNSQGALNSPPLAPTTLQVTTAGDSATLTWNAPTDDHTPANGLTYNVYIGTTSHGVDVASPLSDVATGYRRVVAYGNAGKNNFFKIKGLPQGQFYCGVQAIDGAFAGSPFSSEISFSTNGTGVDNSTSAIHAFSVYPNPSARMLNIILPATSLLSVYSIQGAFMADMKNTSVYPINTTLELKSGVYIFKCTQKEKVVLKKVIVLN